MAPITHLSERTAGRCVSAGRKETRVLLAMVVVVVGILPSAAHRWPDLSLGARLWATRYCAHFTGEDEAAVKKGSTL